MTATPLLSLRRHLWPTASIFREFGKFPEMLSPEAIKSRSLKDLAGDPVRFPKF
jgi:hypothetical protein